MTPWAWAKGTILNVSNNPTPKIVSSESNAGEQIDNFNSTTGQCANDHTGPNACIYNRVVTSSSTEHLLTCGGGDRYWSCITAVSNYHKDRTCTRCGLTYQNCTNHATACQNTRRPTQANDPYLTGACGHAYRKRLTSNH